jgi:hypothetical protein
VSSDLASKKQQAVNDGLDSLTSVSSKCCSFAAGSSADIPRMSDLSKLSTDIIIYIMSLAAPLFYQCISLGMGGHPDIKPALLPMAPNMWTSAGVQGSDDGGGANIVEPGL